MSGLHDRYTVTRSDGSSGPGRKHERCAYFVLDLEHDRFAIPALRAYAKACAETRPDLAKDLREVVRAHERIETSRCNCREVGCPHSLGQSFLSDASQTAIEIIAKNESKP